MRISFWFLMQFSLYNEVAVICHSAANFYLFGIVTAPLIIQVASHLIISFS